jgi:hypothetical protein
MILSIHSSAFGATLWPQTWPPFKFPPPAPLDRASDSLWSPQPQDQDDLLADTAVVPAATSTLYSTRLREGKAAPDLGEDRFQISFLDQRIALMRYDASHGSVAA